ncbi:MAG: N-acetylmannosamine-6-phosphate 2-epimerase [Candidatus Izemoplasmataceae bacterium]
MLDRIKNGLVVSCQALPNEPLHNPLIMAKMALAAKIGGAVGIRANSVADIIAIKKEVDLPVIGLIKRDFENCDVFITPTKEEVLELLDAKCEMIAIDATKRNRPNGDSIKDLVELVHNNGVLAMADISTYEEAIEAEKVGFDCVSTTLSGYTPYSPQIKEPDYDLIEKLVQNLSIPVVAEGRITLPEHATKIKKLNPHSIVIGSAITRPQLITKTFLEAIQLKD